MLAPLLGLAALLAQGPDLRALYDVQTYRLDLEVLPEAGTLRGTVGVEARALEPLEAIELDLMAGRKVLAVREVGARIEPGSSLAGAALAFTHEGERIRATLLRRHEKGAAVRVAVDYEFTPTPNDRAGILFNKTPDGRPWITTTCQITGAHSWWPQKGENEHPQDKFARLFMNVTVPKGLTAVCNGRLTGKTPGAATETFHWRHDYPCENYAVALNVAPYVELSGELKLKGMAKPLPYSYFVLPQDVEKAKLQFQDVPAMLDAFGDAFGPFPFPNSKFGLVQTPFWGMEHSTAVAYGNSFPAWIKLHGGNDRWAGMNKYFDYILIHEVAHEWWGNAVSAADWGHFWVHEGFATYAEGVYVEKLMGRAKADEYFATMRPRVSEQFRMYRGRGVRPSQAYSNNLYYKGALILNTLRHYVDDDKAWWKALREFNMRFRYRNADTENFRAVLEEVTGKKWDSFFEQWFYGDGYPALKGTVAAEPGKIVVDVENPPVREVGFDVPVDLVWREGAREVKRRVLLRPGSNRLEIATRGRASGLQVANLQRVLGKHEVAVVAE